MVKLKNVAERAGLGVSTVSAVLNGKQYCYVSEANKEMIRKIAAEMGYVPNRMSRGMQGLPTNTIGLVGSLFSVPVTNALVANFNFLIEANGYFAVLGDTRSEVAREKMILNEFLSRGIDGFLLQNCMGKDTLDETLRGRVPYVRFGQEDGGGTSVTMSRKDGAFLAVEHLIKAHKRCRIGFLTCDEKSNSAKMAGYQAALHAYAMPYREDYRMEISSVMAAAEAREVIASRKLDAVFCSNDFIAGHLIKDLTTNGLRIPDDVAVIGFDGSDLICDMVQPSLTSVRHPVEEVARTAVHLLLEMLKGRDVEEKTYYIDPVLRIGASCGCAPTA